MGYLRNGVIFRVAHYPSQAGLVDVELGGSQGKCVRPLPAIRFLRHTWTLDLRRAHHTTLTARKYHKL